MLATTRRIPRPASMECDGHGPSTSHNEYCADDSQRSSLFSANRPEASGLTKQEHDNLAAAGLRGHHGLGLKHPAVSELVLPWKTLRLSNATEPSK